MRTVYLAGQFVPEAEAKISVYDLSVAQGAAAFTMTRSFRKQHFKLPQHLARLQQSCELLSIPLPEDFGRLPAIIEDLTARNAPCFAEDDEYRMMLVVSPGAAPMYAGIAGAIPTPWLYATMFPLRYTVRGFGKYYTEGVHCVTSQIRQVPSGCIPSSAKHRSRLHFHLAQQQAPAGTWPLMQDIYGRYTEAPGANICYVVDGLVYGYPWNALPGISMQTVCELMESRYGTYAHMERPHELDELWLTGTPFCALPVVSLDGKPIGDGTPGPVYRQTLAKWSELVGVRIDEQIIRWDDDAKSTEAV